MAMGTTGNIYTSGALDILIEKVALAQFDANNYFMNLGDKRTLPKGTNSYKFNVVDAGTLVSNGVLTEGVVPTDTSFNMTQVPVTMTQLGAFTKFSDILLSDAPTDVITDAGRELGRLLGDQADTNIQAVIDGGSNVIYSGDATSTATIDASDNLDAGDLAKSFAKLRGNKAPFFEGGRYVAVLHPDVAHDLMTSTTVGSFIDVNKYSNPEAIFRGEIGTLNGVRVISAPNVTINTDAGDATTDVYYTFVLGQKAYGVVTADTMGMTINMPGSAGTSDPLAQFGTVGAKLRFGAALLKEEAIYRIESASSIGANS